MQNVIDVLKERGLLEQTTSDAVKEITRSPIRVYCGFDPTADGLHLGNMVPIMVLAWFQRCGHTPFAIMGGATGMIGDPSGKKAERTLLDRNTLEVNIDGIRKDLERVLERNSSHILNNFDWFSQFSFLDFLRDVGKHFRVGVMLSKESVRDRMQSEEGMSFTEFSYQVLQGYDFYHLFSQYGVTMQIGGSDQWGNITAGMDLIKKLTGKSAYGVTVPLLTKSDGEKFGKSESGALWMSPEKMSSYDLYQQMIRVADADVIKLLRMLTFVDVNDIRCLESDMKQQEYQPNTAQKFLARQLVTLLHGEDSLLRALKATEGLQPGVNLGEAVSAEDLLALKGSVPFATFAEKEVVSKKLVDVITTAGFMPSKSEVRRLIKNGGLYVNGQKIEDAERVLEYTDLIDQRVLLLALGKKNKAVIELVLD